MCFFNGLYHTLPHFFDLNAVTYIGDSFKQMIQLITLTDGSDVRLYPIVLGTKQELHFHLFAYPYS